MLGLLDFSSQLFLLSINDDEIISVINYAMRDVGNKAFNYFRFFLQGYVTVLVILNVIAPFFHPDSVLTLDSLISVPILFIGTGYFLNRLYYFFTAPEM